MLYSIFISACVSAFIVFIVYILTRRANDSPKKQEEAKKKAIERGHVVTATLKKTLIPEAGDTRDYLSQIETGVYEYEYKGKKYKCRIPMDNPPYKMELYFLKNPRKASPEYNMDLSEFNWVLFAIIVFCIIWIL
jgi:hypothetical protein